MLAFFCGSCWFMFVDVVLRLMLVDVGWLVLFATIFLLSYTLGLSITGAATAASAVAPRAARTSASDSHNVLHGFKNLLLLLPPPPPSPFYPILNFGFYL